MTNLNPVAIEEAIRGCANRIANGVSVCSERYSAYLEADRNYEWAYHEAYDSYEGPAHCKKSHAVLATKDERVARDQADVAYKFADRKAHALESELRAWQSVGASVRQMYGVAGRGEGA
jgi:hypothetical protein